VLFGRHTRHLLTYKNALPPLSLEASLCHFLIGVAHVSDRGLVYRQCASFFPSFLSSHQKNLQFDPLGYWYFNFSPYSIDFSFVVLVLLLKFYLFSISSLNPNLPNIIFFNLVLILWTSNFLP